MGTRKNAPPPLTLLDGGSQDVEAMPEMNAVIPVPTEGIWGTQPPLDPSLMDIPKIVILTRQIFGTDDLSLLIPKVSAPPPYPFFGCSPSNLSSVNYDEFVFAFV
jgi:hypothetical protein